MNPDSLSLIGLQLGAYRIVSLLGKGGMGEVYRAHDARLGRDVAIKILPTQWAADPERLARFETEARILAALNHQHIAAIYGFDEFDGTRGIVLELVEGPTLADLIATGVTSGSTGHGGSRTLLSSRVRLPMPSRPRTPRASFIATSSLPTSR